MQHKHDISVQEFLNHHFDQHLLSIWINRFFDWLTFFSFQNYCFESQIFEEVWYKKAIRISLLLSHRRKSERFWEEVVIH